MPYTKIEAQFPGGDPIRLIKVAFGASWYAAGPCHVFLGGSRLTGKEPAIAVMYHNGSKGETDKHINLRTHATDWLAERWLNRGTAELLIDLALEVCKPDDVQPVDVQVIEGDYFETLEKIRDELLAGVKEGSITDRRTLSARICTCVENSVYPNAYEMSLTALRFCKDRPTGQVQRLAKSVMYDGVFRLVRETEEWKALPKKTQPA